MVSASVMTRTVKPRRKRGLPALDTGPVVSTRGVPQIADDVHQALQNETVRALTAQQEQQLDSQIRNSTAELRARKLAAMQQRYQPAHIRRTRPAGDLGWFGPDYGPESDDE